MPDENASRKLKILFVCGDNSGPAYHDIFIPSLFLQKYDLFECKSSYILDYSIIYAHDIIVFQRQYVPESFMVLQQLKRKGKVCVFICDDNVWEIPKGNPAKATYDQGDVMLRYLSILSGCDAVTTSTPYLKELCSKHNPNTYIFRNLVDPVIESFKSPGRDVPNEIRVGWTGTPHHHDDIIIIEEALLKILNKYPNVKLIFMGYHPPHLSTKFSPKRYEYYNFVPVDAFYPALANLDFDIGLVPLEDNGFNRAKTCRKFQEYSILSIPTIAAPVGEYNKLPDTALCRVSANTTKGWVEAISKLVEDKQAREELGIIAHQYLIDNHDINKYIYERAQVYFDIYAKVTGSERRVVWGKPDED